MENSSPENCYDSLSALLKSDTPVDAVFCFNDEIAHHAARAAEDIGLRISDDIGIIGYDDIITYRGTSIPLTSVSYQTEEIGRLAAGVLQKMIEKKEPESFNVINFGKNKKETWYFIKMPGLFFPKVLSI